MEKTDEWMKARGAIIKGLREEAVKPYPPKTSSTIERWHQHIVGAIH